MKVGKVTDGDEMVRTDLYETANVLLSRVMRFSALKRGGMEVAKRRCLKRAKVAAALDSQDHVPVDQSRSGPRMIRSRPITA